MKQLQTQLACMKNRDLVIDEMDCVPSIDYPNAPNYGYHDFFEMEVYLSGKGLHYLNGIPYEVSAGYVYLLLPGDFHRYELESKERMHMLNIKISPRRMPERLRDAIAKAQHPCVCYLDEDKLGLLVREVRYLAELLRESPSDRYLCDNVMERIVLLLMRSLPSPGVQTPSDVNSSVVREAVLYINEHYHQRVSQAELARAVGLSTNYFGVYFKAQTGLFVREYLMRVRLFRGAQLLKSTRMKIAEIASRTGFGSSEYFARSFREHFGMTPKQYRDSLFE